MEFLEAATWITISKIILIDILLAGDNASLLVWQRVNCRQNYKRKPLSGVQ